MYCGTRKHASSVWVLLKESPRRLTSRKKLSTAPPFRASMYAKVAKVFGAKTMHVAGFEAKIKIFNKLSMSYVPCPSRRVHTIRT